MQIEAEGLYKSIDGNPIKNPVAWCKCHHTYLSVRQTKLHKCRSRGCTGFVEMDCEYWEEKKRRKHEAKERKKKWR